VTTSEGRALPAATDADPQTNRPTLPVGRPRLAVPTASGLPQDISNYDDGFTNYTQCNPNAPSRDVERRCHLLNFILYFRV